MRDAILSLFSKLQPHQVLLFIISILGVSISVWYLSHTAAEPGTTVRVLWGLSEYTKQKNIQDSRAMKQSAENFVLNESIPIIGNSPKIEDQQEPARQNGSTSKEIINERHDQHQTSIFMEVPKDPINFIENELNKMNFTLIHILDAGKEIKSAPQKTYFFCNPYSFELFESTIIYRDRRSHLFYCAKNGERDYYIVSFVPISDALRIRNIESDAAVDVTLSSNNVLDFKAMAFIPFNRLISTSSRQIEIDEQFVSIIEARVR